MKDGIKNKKVQFILKTGDLQIVPGRISERQL
jgi:hypothetical protein